ncbi:hypothetical protein HNP93_001410 [Methanococcus maripaludis]|uniref:Uncharacterized protein n=1 Tax=Methanococcus maripaludis TaxID=39152 RepID=A0A7J9PB78_METMI|nr:hypothetical protein [Methanococcus maripaludis]MBA2858709.1 hypothetical protein [Methanococcus maripaludis]
MTSFKEIIIGAIVFSSVLAFLSAIVQFPGVPSGFWGVIINFLTGNYYFFNMFSASATSAVHIITLAFVLIDDLFLLYLGVEFFDMFRY